MTQHPEPLPIDMTGKHVVVTGAATGIGRAMADAFAVRGAAVYICDVSGPALEKALKDNPRLTGSVTDVSDVASVQRMFDDVDARFKTVDVLINNAGIAGPTAGIADIAPDDLRATLSIDVESMFHCAKRVVGYMLKAGGGRIINISSVAGRLSYAMRTPYAAAKWGVVGFTKSLALELGRQNIQVNAILPGHVNTSRFDGVIARRATSLGLSHEEVERQMLDYVAMGKKVEVHDIANMALYLASPFGAAISGQAISVCRGVEMMR